MIDIDGVSRLCRKIIQLYIQDKCFPYMPEDWFTEVCCLAGYDAEYLKRKLNELYGDMYE